MTAAAPGAQADEVVGWTPDDLHAWQILRPLLDAGGYLPWSSGAMRPAGLVEVCNTIVLDRRRRIVELGAGASTVLLARLARSAGAAVDAIEHDDRWARWVRGQLAREGLDDVARIHHVPLAQSPAFARSPWYGIAPLSAALAGEPIDLLVVDGPPAFDPGASQARHPALPTLDDRLTGDATVILDDLARPGEQQVLDRWERETDWRFERRDRAGIAIGRRAFRAPP